MGTPVSSVVSSVCGPTLCLLSASLLVKNGFYKFSKKSAMLTGTQTQVAPQPVDPTTGTAPSLWSPAVSAVVGSGLQVPPTSPRG